MSDIEYHAEIGEFYHDTLWDRLMVGRDFEEGMKSWSLRTELTKKFAWAIPNAEALELLAGFAPLVEIGAGTGYWAYELRKRGVEIHAYDRFPPNGEVVSDEEAEAIRNGAAETKNWYHQGHHAWTEVRKGTQAVLKKYEPNWNLFLCWPPMTPMAYSALRFFRGEFVCYVGEGEYGCTADDAFHSRLRKYFERVAWEPIPQWYGIHDSLEVWQRKPST